jgi:type II secretory pathway component PulF
LAYLIKKNKYIKIRYHEILLKTPILGLYIKIKILSSVCSIGEIILSSGRSLTEFHSFSYNSSNNLIFKDAFNKIYDQSIQGISFTNSMKLYPNLFLRIMIDMCSIGERTGNLALMFGHCSRIFEQDIDLFLKRFSSLIEPVLMIFMGLIVGSIALSIILPVYEITNHLSK